MKKGGAKEASGGGTGQQKVVAFEFPMYDDTTPGAGGMGALPDESGLYDEYPAESPAFNAGNETYAYGFDHTSNGNAEDPVGSGNDEDNNYMAYDGLEAEAEADIKPRSLPLRGMSRFDHIEGSTGTESDASSETEPLAKQSRAGLRRRGSKRRRSKKGKTGPIRQQTSIYAHPGGNSDNSAAWVECQKKCLLPTQSGPGAVCC